MSAARDRLRAFVPSNFPVLLVAILALAAFNLTFRLGEQTITEWDESLYGLSAAEMLERGEWVAT